MAKEAVHIGQVVRNAVVFNAQRWREGEMNGEPLLRTVQELFALLDERQVSYVLVGGIALLSYVEGRNTEDIDLIMALPSLEKLPEIDIQERDRYFVRGRFKGLQIDVLLTENPLFRLVQERYTTEQTFLERAIPTATVEGLLLLKLYALPSLYRQGDFLRVGIYENDIAALMYAYQPDTEKPLQTLSAYLSENDLSSLKQIVAEIEERIQRFRQGKAGSTE